MVLSVGPAVRLLVGSQDVLVGAAHLCRLQADLKRLKISAGSTGGGSGRCLSSSPTGQVPVVWSEHTVGDVIVRRGAMRRACALLNRKSGRAIGFLSVRSNEAVTW